MPQPRQQREGAAAESAPADVSGAFPLAAARIDRESAAETTERSPTTAGGASAADAVTILVAEDDAGIRALATKILSREGYRVLSAGDGEQAVELFEREADRISLVVLDDVMPRMGGRAALDLMRRNAPDLPAILCSGYTWQLDGGTPPGAGFSRVLTKPWQPLELLRRVREGLGA